MFKQHKNLWASLLSFFRYQKYLMIPWNVINYAVKTAGTIWHGVQHLTWYCDVDTTDLSKFDVENTHHLKSPFSDKRYFFFNLLLNFNLWKLLSESSISKYIWSRWSAVGINTKHSTCKNPASLAGEYDRIQNMTLMTWKKIFSGDSTYHLPKN